MISKGDSRLKSCIVYGGFFALACLILLGAGTVFSDYGYYDDYWQLFDYTHGNFKFPTSQMHQTGRPVQDLISRPLFTSLAGVEGLRWIRLLNILISAAFGASCLFLLRRITGFRMEAIPLALLLILTPAFGVYIGFACMVHAGFSLLVSVWSGYLCYARWQRRDTSTGWRRLTIVTGFLGILIAEASYQPTASAFLLPFILCVLKNPSQRASNILAVKGVALFMAGMVGYFAYYKASLQLWVGDGWQTERANVGLGMIEQAAHVMTSILPQIASIWEIFRTARPLSGTGIFLDHLMNPMVSIGLLTFVCYTIVRPVATEWKSSHAWLTSALLAGFFGLIFVPIVATPERTFNMRLFAVIYIAIFAYAYFGVAAIFRSLSREFVRLLSRILLVLATVYATDQLWFNVRYYIVEPSQIEFASLKASVEERFDSYPLAMLYVSPEEGARNSDYSRTRVGDYGHRFATLEWGPTNAIRLILNTHLTGNIRHLPSKDVGILMISSAGHVPSGWATTINGVELFQNGLSPRRSPEELAEEDPLWGRIIRYPNGWFFSPMLGYLNSYYSPWIQHLQLGTLYLNRPHRMLILDHPEFGQISCRIQDLRYWWGGDGTLYRIAFGVDAWTIVKAPEEQS